MLALRGLLARGAKVAAPPDMSFRKILCPIDFSPGADQALRLAVQLATRSNAELVISHTWFVPPLAYAGEWMLAGDVVQQMVDQDEAGLAMAVTEAVRLGAPRVTSVLGNGAPGEQIVKALADDPAFDLVVVGTHGRTGLSRVLLGSVAEYVVRHAPCSILAARSRLEDAPFKNVLCPIDFSDRARQAVDLAATLVEPGGTGITLLHAIELPTSYGQEPPLMDLAEEVDRQTAEVLDKWVGQVREKVRVPVSGQSCRGGAGGQVLRVLDQGHYDLVVMGSHGRTGIRRVFLGSVAEKVVRHAPCPVLVARPRVP